ncbi:hypothetical protein SBRY_10395 [Actinacidiphila bryophytorum]|uniref:Uncharacterized protein n=1 Tax=Actinacidiphila bryophytorum TaxID=1436133 RepID=A0A9W4GX42_9ACTN|nr:hypothetical protein SBRY_10395 [Actinacidiphila bryophytorum]
MRKWDERQHPTRSRIHGPVPPGPSLPPAPALHPTPRRELARRQNGGGAAVRFRLLYAADRARRPAGTAARRGPRRPRTARPGP